MPMEQVSKDRPLTKAQFHQRLREWVNSTSTDGNQIVGPEGVDGRMRWIYVHDGRHLFVLHADTPRHAVDQYLSLAAEYGDELLWTVARSRRGKMTAVAYGPDDPPQRIVPFYLYMA